MARQLALAFTPKEDFSLQRLVAGDNAQLIADSKACAKGAGEPFVYIWGGMDTGKSHLLQALVKSASEDGRSATYIPLDQAAQFDPEILQGLDDFDLVCLDNIDQVAGNEKWEVALFNLFNQIRDKQNHLIISAQHPIAQLGLDLKDLSSRLTWGLTHQLKPLNDEEKLACLIEDAARRGLTMHQDTASYIMRNYPRDMSSLRRMLNELDTASLEDQRRLTIPFIKQRLASHR